jgi:sigma-B regulation protein RsbU (phosphoserine phosphatase)
MKLLPAAAHKRPWRSTSKGVSVWSYPTSRCLGFSGVELLRMISDINPDIPVILMTAYAELEIAIDAIRKGAFDFIIKPYKPEYLRHAVKKGIRFRQLIELEKNHTAMLEEKVSESEENLKAAAVIQQSLLPLYAPKVNTFDFAWQFLPCKRVGGDLFNLFWLDETRLGIYVLDVSGHGVPAAMVTTSVAQALDPFRGRLLKRTIDSPPFYELVPPGEVLAELNRDYPIERFDKLLTICYLILDIQSGKVLYSNAALPLPFLIRADGRVETLSEGGTIIGIGEGADYEEGAVSMEKDDRLFIYTDGIIEYFDKRGEPYGEEKAGKGTKGSQRRSAANGLRSCHTIPDAFRAPTAIARRYYFTGHRCYVIFVSSEGDLHVKGETLSEMDSWQTFSYVVSLQTIYERRCANCSM